MSGSDKLQAPQSSKGENPLPSLALVLEIFCEEEIDPRVCDDPVYNMCEEKLFKDIKKLRAEQKLILGINKSYCV